MASEDPIIAAKLLAWYETQGRKHLPWQQSRDAYRIWVSEIMLQQTQVKTVLDYYPRFIQRFSDVTELARAEIDEVLSFWSGLGYYARARNLHKAAQMIVQQHGGVFPRDFEQVLALPGIGRSTAGAILAFADGQHWPILDGNVKRVLSRFYRIHGFVGQSATEKRLWQLAEQNTPKQNIAAYTQAIMDLGALICTRSKPACLKCPLAQDCQALAHDEVSQLPTPKPKKTKPEQSIIMLIVIDRGKRVYLKQRPPTGIWGGLWSLPECELDTCLLDYCQQHLGMRVTSATELAPFKHRFSHYTLQISPKVMQLVAIESLQEDNGDWFESKQINQLGLPKPVKSILDEIENLKL